MNSESSSFQSSQTRGETESQIEISAKPKNTDNTTQEEEKEEVVAPPHITAEETIHVEATAADSVVDETIAPCLDEEKSSSVPPAASLIEISPALDANPCLNDTENNNHINTSEASAATFSNDETINASINLNEPKETTTEEARVETTMQSKTVVESEMVLVGNDEKTGPESETAEQGQEANVATDSKNGDVDAANQISTSAQEIIIETSEF